MPNEREKKRRTPFVYQRRSDEQIRQLLRIGQFDDDIINAHRGDTKGLCEYLETADLPLSQDQREQIAELIRRRIQRKHALRIAARFFDRSIDTMTFKRGMDAYNNLDFYRQLGKNPEQLIASALELLAKKFNLQRR